MVDLVGTTHTLISGPASMLLSKKYPNIKMLTYITSGSVQDQVPSMRWKYSAQAIS